MADSLNRPLPVVTEMTYPFWEGAKKGKLMLQKCQECETFNFHPKVWCIDCGSRNLVWTEAKPWGTIYSFTISYTVAMNYPGWETDLPLVMCLVDLDDGARMYAQLKDCKIDQVKIGMRVKAHFESISDEFGIPKFHPA